MIYLIGTATEPSDSYQQASFSDFVNWLDYNDSYFEFDIETNVTDWWCDKKIITLQFGSGGDQWVLQWSELTDTYKEVIKNLLESKDHTKLIHNAMFECVVCLFHGIRIQNVTDTMLQEQVLYGGEQNPQLGYGLDDTVFRRLKLVLDKSEQTTFGDNILTPNKIRYAAQDVTYLNTIHQQQLRELKHYSNEFNPCGLLKVAELENNAMLAFAEMVYHGMEIDQDWWRKLQDEAEPLVAEAHRKLTGWLLKEPFYAKALELKYVSTEDRMLVNWASPQQKKRIFDELFPELPGTTKAVLKRYVSNLIKNNQQVPHWLPYYMDGDYSELELELHAWHRQWLINSQLLIPAGTPTINWNSQDQVLPIMKVVEPQMKDLSEESRGRCTHPILADFEKYKETIKLLTAFGEQWLQKYVEPDGKVRTRFNQVLTTGRTSSSGPNMQQIPAKEEVGNKYRNAFIAPPGFVYVSSDYSMQELVTIAFLSKDPVWMEALEKGQDIHSIVAEMMEGKKWKEGAEENCAYYQRVVNGQGQLVVAKQKCGCKKHKPIRYDMKTVDFGLAYGMSEYKLASELKISVPQAKQKLQDYFKAFPKIGNLLTFLGEFGVKNGYIQTIYPYYRRRWFPNWKFYRSHIDEHVSGSRYNEHLGSIERQSKNMPIQGSCADMMKAAACYIYDYIHEHKLEDKVYLVMQVHDQMDTICRQEYAEEWSKKLTELMQEAAKVIIPTGILKAETTITERWSK
jgi:DNA polymerase I-like protein with 3'-5' exonuclease and polymerase domains